LSAPYYPGASASLTSTDGTFSFDAGGNQEEGLAKKAVTSISLSFRVAAEAADEAVGGSQAETRSPAFSMAELAGKSSCGSQAETLSCVSRPSHDIGGNQEEALLLLTSNAATSMCPLTSAA
jgi:hypothetical protein